MPAFSALAPSLPPLSTLGGSPRYSPAPSPLFSSAGPTPSPASSSTAVGSPVYSPAPSPSFLSAGPTSSPPPPPSSAVGSPTYSPSPRIPSAGPTPSPGGPGGAPLPAGPDSPSSGSSSLFLPYWLSSRGPPARSGSVCVPPGPLLRFSAYLVQPGLFVTPPRPRFSGPSPFVQGPSSPLAPGSPVAAPLSAVPSAGEQLEQEVRYTRLRAEYDRRGRSIEILQARVAERDQEISSLRDQLRGLEEELLAWRRGDRH